MDLISLIITCIYFGATNIFGDALSNNLWRSKLASQHSIVGGHNTTIEKHPYQVYFTYTQKGGGETRTCGGFIISENYILTAGHCIFDVDTSSVELRAGSNRNDDGTIIPIAELILYPGYKLLKIDVGIMKTVNPIQFSDTIQPIKLAPKGKPMVDGSMVTVTGWGQTIEDGPDSNYLLAVEVPVVNFDKCKKVYPDSLTENLWCAGYFETGGKDTCKGDSGGAAVQDGVAVGIVSFGQGCARPGYPGVYTYIAAPAVRDFITKETGL